MPLPISNANFTTSLAARISSTATTLTLNRSTDSDSVTLSGTYYLTFDEGASTEEHMIVTLAGAAGTIVTRGLSRVNAVNNIAANQYAHDRGASVKMTDLGYVRIVRRLNGTEAFDSVDWTGVNSISGLATPLSSELTKAANIQFVVNTAIAGAVDASTVTKGIVEEATDAELQAGTAVGGTGARLFAGGVSHAQTAAAGKVPVANSSGVIDDAYIALTTRGDMPYRDATNINRLAIGASGRYMRSDGTDPTWSGANLDEANTFFGATDITGAEAETLTNGSDANALHVHTPLVGFFVIESPIGNSEDGESLRSIVADGSGNAYLSRNTGSQLNLYRLQQDSLSQLYYYGGTNTDLTIAGGGTEVNSCAVGATYVWAGGRNGAGTDIIINRWDKNLTNSTNITISGAANANVMTFVAGNDTTLYFWRQSSNVIDIYTISGTTATRGGTITLSDAAQPQTSNGFWFDGTSFFVVDDSAGFNAIKKYNSTGTLQSTTFKGFFNAGNSTSASERGISRGIIPAWTGAIYLVGEFTVSDDTAAVLSTEWRFCALTKP